MSESRFGVDGKPVDKSEVVEYPEIAELEYPVERIFTQLKSEISRGEYSMVIGVDAAGRVPALLIREAINNVYEHNSKNKIPIFFYAGYGQLTDPNVKAEKTEGIKTSLTKLLKYNIVDLSGDKRILLVDDAISKGRSTGPLISLIMEMGYKVDIAAIGWVEPSAGSAVSKKESGQDRMLDVKVAIGTKGIPSIYQAPHLSGVTKSQDQAHSSGFSMATKRMEKSLKSLDYRTPEQEEKLGAIRKASDGDLDTFFAHMQIEGINIARKDLRVLAKKVANKFLETGG
jgi:adenine/guanine phosphoribosyltransferase-like PRPP-binding protein